MRRGVYLVFGVLLISLIAGVFAPPAPAPASAGDCTSASVWCDIWAINGECWRNPGYMLIKCPRSCVCVSDALCYNTTEGRAECESTLNTAPYEHILTQYRQDACQRACMICGAGIGCCEYPSVPDGSSNAAAPVSVQSQDTEGNADEIEIKDNQNDRESNSSSSILSSTSEPSILSPENASSILSEDDSQISSSGASTQSPKAVSSTQSSVKESTTQSLANESPESSKTPTRSTGPTDRNATVLTTKPTPHTSRPPTSPPTSPTTASATSAKAASKTTQRPTTTPTTHTTTTTTTTTKTTTRKATSSSSSSSSSSSLSSSSSSPATSSSSSSSAFTTQHTPTTHKATSTTKRTTSKDEVTPTMDYRTALPDGWEPIQPYDEGEDDDDDDDEADGDAPGVLVADKPVVDMSDVLDRKHDGNPIQMHISSLVLKENPKWEGYYEQDNNTSVEIELDIKTVDERSDEVELEANFKQFDEEIEVIGEVQPNGEIDLFPKLNPDGANDGEDDDEDNDDPLLGDPDWKIQGHVYFDTEVEEWSVRGNISNSRNKEIFVLEPDGGLPLPPCDNSCSDESGGSGHWLAWVIGLVIFLLTLLGVGIYLMLRVS